MTREYLLEASDYFEVTPGGNWIKIYYSQPEMVGHHCELSVQWVKPVGFFHSVTPLPTTEDRVTKGLVPVGNQQFEPRDDGGT